MPRCRSLSPFSGATPADIFAIEGQVLLPCTQTPLKAALLFSQAERSSPATPAIQRKHHKLRKSPTCVSRQNDCKFDDAGTPGFPRILESRDTAARRVPFRLCPSAVPRSTPAILRHVFATAGCIPPAARLVPRGRLPDNTARLILATRGESPRARPAC